VRQAMRILALDTSTRTASVAVLGGAREVEIDHAVGSHSDDLIALCDRALSDAGLKLADLDAVAVGAGPGSFTGLRVGLAAIKALAEILQKPIAAVSLLEAVARALGREGNVLAALDAGRGEIYCGEYEIRGSGARLISQQLWTGVEFAVGAAGRSIATSDVKIAELAREKNLQVTLIAPLRADAIARLGFEKINAGEVVSPVALDAAYLRRSHAEVKKPGLA